MLSKLGQNADIVWELHRMLPGHRVAGAGWVQTASKEFVDEGFERCEALPQFFHRRSDNVLLIEVHMDDFHGCGPEQAGLRLHGGRLLREVAGWRRGWGCSLRCLPVCRWEGASP